jgi:hypothetical protein
MGAEMEWTRRIARVVAVFAIALGAGHLVQTMSHRNAAKPAASAALKEKPKAIEQVAAGPEALAPTPAPAPAPQVTLPKVPLAELAPPRIETPVAETPVAETPAAEAPVAGTAAAACPVTLDLMSEPAAMIGLTLVAPCHPNERVVLQHAGLTVTAMTTATGALFTGLPALESPAQVTIVFADATRAEGSTEIPDLAGLRRFGIQWQGEDFFDLHAFEQNAAYGEPGDVSPQNTRDPSSLLPAGEGFLTLLGDPAAPAPLLAEVYTWPADPAVKADVVIEAIVAAGSCGQEMLGQTVSSVGGRAEVKDLSVAMPECDAEGGYLLLKNLAPEMNIAAVN